MKKTGTAKRILSVLLSLCFICGLLPELSLPASAEALTPSCYIALSSNQYRVSKTENGDGALYDTFQSAVNASTTYKVSNSTLVIQLGSASSPLAVKRGDGTLISATYTGAVNIEYSGSEQTGLTVVSGVTADLQNFTLTNRVNDNDHIPYNAINVISGGILNVKDGTNITVAEGTSISGATSYGVTCWGGTVNVSGNVSMTAYKDPVIYIGAGSCTLGGVAGTDNICISMQKNDGAAVVNGGIINIGLGVDIKGGTALATFGTAHITGGSLSSSNANTITNNGTLTMSGGIVSNTDTSMNWLRALLNNGNGYATINGGTITSASNQCIFNLGRLNLNGSCEVSCTNPSGMAVGTNSNIQYSTNHDKCIAVGENAYIHSINQGIVNDSSGYCPLTISGGTISAGTEMTGGVAVWAGANTTISGGVVCAIGPNCCAVSTSGAYELKITDKAAITATGANCMGVSNTMGTITIDGGSISSASGEAYTRTCGIYNSSYDKDQHGTVNITGGTITAKTTGSVTQVSAAGVWNTDYGVVNVSGGTVESLGTSILSSAILDANSLSPGGAVITSSPLLKSASQYTILSNAHTINAGAFSCFDTKFYNSDHALVAVRGVYDKDSKLYIINGTNYYEAETLAVPNDGYNFVKWTSDAAGVNRISEVNETALPLLAAGGNKNVYLVVMKPPVNAPTSGSFTDTDDTKGTIGGTISWTPPASAADIDDYHIYWGNMGGNILPSNPGVLFASSGSSYTVASSTPIPSGAEFFLIYSHNQAGNSASCAVVRIKDYKNYVMLREDSLGTAGDKRITGLSSGGYYNVTGYYYTDFNPAPTVTTYYVKSDGTLSENPSDGPLNGTEIADSDKLKNIDAEYMVSYASIFLSADSLGEVSNNSAIVESGQRYIITCGEDTWYSKADGYLSLSPSDSAPLTYETIYSLTNGKIYNVQEYVPTSVLLAEDSLGTAGDKKITGLTPGVMYGVKDKTTNVTYYVTAGGTLSEKATDLEGLTGTEITGLTNGDTYKVTCLQVTLLEGSLGVAGNEEVTGLDEGKEYYIFLFIDGEKYLVFSSATSGEPPFAMDESSMAPLPTGVSKISGFPNDMSLYVGEYSDKVPLDENYSTLFEFGELSNFSSGTTVNDWTYHVADSDGNIKDSTGKSYFKVDKNEDESPCLWVSGDADEKESLLIASKKQTESNESSIFRLVSFDLCNSDNGTDGYRIIGYLDGSPVDGALKTVSVNAGDTVTVPFTDAAWDKIDSFRIVPLSGQQEVSGLALGFDNLDVSAAVLSLSPQNSGTNIAVNTNLSLTFSGTVAAIAGKNIYVKKVSDGSTVHTFAMNDEAHVTIETGSVTVTLPSPLEYGTQYYVEIDHGALRDSAGNTLDGLTGSSAWHFTTAAPGTYSVSGTVKDDAASNPIPISGATVKVMQGNTQFGSTATTGADGSFTVTGVPNGSYNLVVTMGDHVVTQMMIVNGADYVCSGNIILPTGNKNSKLEVAADTPNVVVGYLDQQFTGGDSTYAQTPGNTVEIKLTVKSMDEESADGASAIGNIVSGKTVGLYLDMQLMKTLSGAKTSSEPLFQLDSLLKIIVPYDLSEKNSVTVYRYHNGEAQGMKNQAYSETTPSEECYMLNTAANQIIIWTKNFSTYAIAYGTGTGSGGSAPSGSNPVSTGYSITASAGAGGTISSSGSVKVTSGGSKTFDIKADAGYSISDVLVDGKSVGAVSSYTFSNVTAAHTISAVFSKAAELPYYLDGNKKVFIGFSSDESGTMKYIAPEGKTVLFAVNNKSFSDVNGHWAKAYIDFVIEREIFLGTGNNHFSPNTGMTRGMFAAVIGRLYERSNGALAAGGAHAFTDCDYSEWYGPYVDWCAKNGIIEGIGSGLFEPDREITRQEMAAILYRFAKYLKVSPAINDTTLHYTDSEAIDPYAKEAALFSQGTGIITGRDNGRFAPAETVTRAEAAAMIERFIETVV